MLSLLLGFTLPTYESVQARSWWVDGGHGPDLRDGWQIYIQLIGLRLDLMWLPN